MDPEIQQLLSRRLQIAELSRTLSERDLAARTLRLDLEAELRGKGMGKTEAKDVAIAEPRYLEHARQSLQLAYDRAVAEAHAESLLLGIRLRVADLERVEI